MNGYKNYVTWLAALWIDNDQCLYEATLAAVTEAGDKYDAANIVEGIIYEQLPELEGFAADLLNSAVRDIDFVELAEKYRNEADEDYGL